MKQGSSRQSLALLLLTPILFLFLTPAEAAECRHTSEIFRCVKYIKNYDGDTLTVTIPSVHPLLGDNMSVRVLGIDAPEMRSDDPCERQAASKAQEELKSILSDATRINLRSIGRDKYFRVLAEVEVDGVNIAQEMIRRGHAVPYEGGHRPTVNWCHRN